MGMRDIEFIPVEDGIYASLQPASSIQYPVEDPDLQLIVAGVSLPPQAMLRYPPQLVDLSASSGFEVKLL